MITVIRIAGQCKIEQSKKETLNRLNLKKKFNCILVEKTDRVRIGMINKVKDCVAYAEIPKELEEKLMKKQENKQAIALHPPRGGLKKSSKIAYPKGILGNNLDLAKLIERML